jgi:hypothetical protein
MVSANRLQKQNVELRNSGILSVLSPPYELGFRGAWGVRAARIESSLRMRICPGNEALIPKTTIPWQKFAETAET